MARIDHFMWAVANLDDGIAWASETFDCAPVAGGSHVGLGTCNALLSLGDSYLEIIAPDPAQPLTGTLGERLAALSTGGLAAWAASGDLDAIARDLATRGIASRGPIRTERATGSGGLLVWNLLFPEGSGYGGYLPFFIDWLNCPHPAATSPLGGVFESLRISTPDPSTLRRALRTAGLALTCEEGAPALEVIVSCRSGDVVLTSTPETILHQ